MHTVAWLLGPRRRQKAGARGGWGTVTAQGAFLANPRTKPRAGRRREGVWVLPRGLLQGAEQRARAASAVPLLFQAAGAERRRAGQHGQLGLLLADTTGCQG